MGQRWLVPCVPPTSTARSGVQQVFDGQSDPRSGTYTETRFRAAWGSDDRPMEERKLLQQYLPNTADCMDREHRSSWLLWWTIRLSEQIQPVTTTLRMEHPARRPERRMRQTNPSKSYSGFECGTYLLRKDAPSLRTFGRRGRVPI